MSPPVPPLRLADVARESGVSVITASRALRNPSLVAPETRERVEAAARRLGYVPNLVAGALASARTRTVAVLVPTIVSSIFAATINGVTAALEAEGYAILLAQSGYDEARERRALAALLGRRPEAVVLVGSPLSDQSAAMLRQAAAAGTAVVETWELPETPIGAAVGFNNAAAGMAVAAHFAVQGRRRLVMVGGSDGRAAARAEGFAAGALAAGLPPPARLLLPAPASMDDGEALCRADPPALRGADAVFAANDVHAVGLLSGLRAAGRNVPGEIAVIGLGDLDMARHTVPPLSTVRVNGLEIGQRSAALILAAVNGGSADAVLDLGFELVLRGSG